MDVTSWQSSLSINISDAQLGSVVYIEESLWHAVKSSGSTLPTGLRKVKAFLADEYLHEIQTHQDQSY